MRKRNANNPVAKRGVPFGDFSGFGIFKRKNGAKDMISGFFMFWLTLGTLGFAGLLFWFFKAIVFAPHEYGSDD